MKQPWKYIVTSFLIGLLLGGAGGMAYWRHMAHRWIKTNPERFLKRLDRQVHLNDTQRTSIYALLKADRDKLVTYQQTLRMATRAEIRTTLDPAQQASFDAMVARHDAKRIKRDGR